MHLDPQILIMIAIGIKLRTKKGNTNSNTKHNTSNRSKDKNTNHGLQPPPPIFGVLKAIVVGISEVQVGLAEF